MEIVAGIDLAAKEKNPTGICFFISRQEYELKTLYEDGEIVNAINERKPSIVAIDAPMMEKIRIREADRILKKYGAMPPTLPSMKELAERAMRIARKIDSPVIEVFPTASAKIMGFYSRDYREMMEKLGINARNEHEVDAYIAAYTAYLYLKDMAIGVGGKEKIIIPKKI